MRFTTLLTVLAVFITPFCASAQDDGFGSARPDGRMPSTRSSEHQEEGDHLFRRPRARNAFAGHFVKVDVRFSGVDRQAGTAFMNEFIVSEGGIPLREDETGARYALRGIVDARQMASRQRRKDLGTNILGAVGQTFTDILRGRASRSGIQFEAPARYNEYETTEEWEILLDLTENRIQSDRRYAPPLWRTGRLSIHIEKTAGSRTFSIGVSVSGRVLILRRGFSLDLSQSESTYTNSDRVVRAGLRIALASTGLEALPEPETVSDDVIDVMRVTDREDGGQAIVATAVPSVIARLRLLRESSRLVYLDIATADGETLGQGEVVGIVGDKITLRWRERTRLTSSRALHVVVP